MLGLAYARFDDEQPTAARPGAGGVAILARAANDNAGYDYVPLTANVAYAAANALNQYPSVGGYTYSYWPEGGLKQTDTLAANYNELGKLALAYITPTPGTIDPNNDEFMGADALDHVYFHGRQTTAGDTHPFIYHSIDGLRPETVLEWQCTQTGGATPVCAGAGTGTRLYVLGPDPDERWAFTGVSGAIYAPHTDREGTLIALANGGQASRIYTWDAYGQNTAPASDTGPGATGYLYRYTGQRFDPNTSLHDYKARDYSPVLGRFLQPDPAGLDQGPNLYGYVGGDPLGAGDPSGMACDGALPCTTSIGPAHGAGAKSDDARNGSQGKSNASPAFLSPATAAAIRNVGVGAEAAGAAAAGIGTAAARIAAAVVGGVALAFVPSSTASQDMDEPRVTVYRAIGLAEFIRLSATGNYGFSPNGGGKYFCYSLEGALQVSKTPMMDAPYVTSTSLPPSIAYSGHRFNDPGGGGLSVHFSDPQLPEVYRTMTEPNVLRRPGDP